MTCPPGHIQIRRDNTYNWSQANSGLGSYLLPGEFGYDTTAKLFKIGPGNWNSLTYLPLGPQGPTVHLDQVFNLMEEIREQISHSDLH